MKVIDTAIVGLGQIGYAYDTRNETNRTHVSQIKKNKNFKLIAACDSDITKTNQLKNDCEGNIQTYSNYRSMVDNNNIDLLVLAVPSSEQKKIVDYSLSKNIKNFIIEKPFLNNNDEILDTLKKVTAVQGKVYINYPRTWDNEFLTEFKDELSGNIQYINAFISGNFKENGCHLIDLIFQSLFVLGDRPTIASKHLDTKNTSIYFKNKKQSFDISLTHIKSSIDLFEIQIFFPSHILLLEFGGARIYTISIHRNKFYNDYNGMKYNKANFHFDHQKGLESLYSHTYKNFGKSEKWQDKILSSFHIHNLF